MRIGKRHLAGAAVAVALALGATQAQATTELITNGSFETGNMTGWTTNSQYGLNPFGTTLGSGMDGKWWHWLAGRDLADVVTSQLVSGLSIGTTYNLTFIMASEYIGSDHLRVSVDGGAGTIFTATPWNGAVWDNWESKSFSFVATSSSENIQFDTIGLNADGRSFDVGLDNVSLLSATGAVPEPATWAMMLMGFGLMGFGLRNRRKQAVRVTYA